MAAATLDGDKVLSTNGDDVGKIKDIMLDVRSGRIAYAVLASGGFLGIGDKLLAIPWSAPRVSERFPTSNDVRSARCATPAWRADSTFVER
jgi:hypothetical protein